MRSNLSLLLNGIAALIYVFVLLVVANYLLSHVPIGRGYQDGVILEISENGDRIKTWEGKLCLPALSNHSIDHRRSWEFSLDKGVVLHASGALEKGRKVRLHYKKVLCPDFVGSNTTNIVQRIESIND